MTYEVFTFEGNIDEENIKYIIGENKFRYKLLKAILVSKVKSTKTYFFVFEENVMKQIEYDYKVITMEKANSTNDGYLQDIAKKLNDFQMEYKLCCVLSDANSLFIVLMTPSTDEGSIDFIDI